MNAAVERARATVPELVARLEIASAARGGACPTYGATPFIGDVR
jgi:hypothetical protein